MKELTKAEEQVMQVLWDIEKGVVRDVLDKLPDPKPAYNTVSTVIRILEKKGVVDHEAFGKTHVYFPLLSKDDYLEQRMKGLMEGYFESSPQNLLSFLVEKEEIDINELDDILRILKEQKDGK